MSREWRLRAAASAAGGLALAVAELAGVGEAAPASGAAVDRGVHPGLVRGQITFEKSRAHPWNSRITWVARRQRADGTWEVLASDSWRAGSGFPGRSTTNACAKNRGWLPNGRYALRQYGDWHGTLIHGRVFRLADKRCVDGTLREQLFIHTEAGPGNTQCPNRPGDQICRWEFPRINDYTSHGCIKMSPSALLQLTRAYHRFFQAGVRYPTYRVSLLVR